MKGYLALGVSLGLAAGMSPGPLLMYTVVATLRGGWRAGLGVALAPLITDAPIILLALIILRLLPEEALRVLGLIGGAFVVYLGVETIRSARRTPDIRLENHVSTRQELGRGILVNFLNPNPYLFWGTVGGPILLQAGRENFLGAAAFVLGFYVFLVGDKVLVALIAHRQRSWLQGVWYRRILWVLGGLLIVLGVGLAVGG